METSKRQIINKAVMPTDTHFKEMPTGYVHAFRKIKDEDRPLGFRLKYVMLFDKAIVVNQKPSFTDPLPVEETEEQENI